jgi:uncharacterized radical SAM protein YgiQ
MARPGGPSRSFLPTTREEMAAWGWRELDVLLITGDAYVDHPAFGASVIGRVLEARGLRVGIVAQPDWRSPEAIGRLGVPRLMVGITAGNLDSMLGKLTAQHKVRSEDHGSPGGRPGLRPNRATIVYANLARQAFGRVPIVLGGIEASLRRIAHYDTWADEVRRSVLLDAKADLLLFGMAERAVVELAERLRAGESVERIRDVRGTAVAGRQGEWAELAVSRRIGEPGVVRLPSYEQVRADKRAFSDMTRLVALESSPFAGRPLLQPHGVEAVLLNSPAMPLGTAELDQIVELPFARAPHPSYRERIPAFEPVRHSVVTVRGCFGGCAFCSLTEHQGRVIQSRSAESVLREIRQLAARPDFAGTVSDLGGPTANMYGLGCGRPELGALCRRTSCLHPEICRHLAVDHGPLLALLERARRVPGVAHVYLASGVRHDLALRSPAFVRALARHHTPGQLSVAPEHSCAEVLGAMRKPPIASYERFSAAFERESRAAGKEQYLVPYFITGHPGATLEHAVELALFLKRHGIRPRQVQDFIPTPMSLATSMYVTGLDPLSGKPVACARTMREKRLHKALALYWDPAHHREVREALRLVGRTDLIGSGRDGLVPPARGKGALPRQARPRPRQR